MPQFALTTAEKLPLRQQGTISFRVGGGRKWHDAQASLDYPLLTLVTPNGDDHVFALGGCELRSIEGESRGAQLYIPSRKDDEQLFLRDDDDMVWREWRFALERSALRDKRASLSQLSPEQLAALRNSPDSDDDGERGPGGAVTVAGNCSVVLRSRRMSSEGAVAVAPGSLQHFGITARDAEGHHRETGGDDFKVVVSLAGRAVEAQVRDNENGTYSVTYTVPQLPAAGRRASMRRPPRKAPPTAASAQDQQNLTRMGFLVKSDPKGRSWKKRWFVLDVRQQTLSYFKNRRSKKPKGVIELCPRGRPVQMSANPHPNAASRHILQVITPRRTYNLCAASPQQIDFWFTEISQALRPAPAPSGRSGRGAPTGAPRGPPARGQAPAARAAAPAAPGAAASGAGAAPASVPGAEPVGMPGAPPPVHTGPQLSIAVSLGGELVRGSPFTIDVLEIYRPRGASLAAEMQCFDVALQGAGPLGIGLESSGEPPHLQLEITAVNENGRAWESGAVEVGDMIFAVQGHDVAQLDFSEVIALLKASGGNCMLQLGRYVFDEMLPDLSADELAKSAGGAQASSSEDDEPDLMDIVANPQRRPKSSRGVDGADKRWGAMPMPPPWAPIEDMAAFAQWHREQAAFVLGPLQANSAQQAASSAWQHRLAVWRPDGAVEELSGLRNALASSDFSERVPICGLLDRAIDSDAELRARKRAQAAWSSATTSMSAVLKFQKAMHARVGAKPSAAAAPRRATAAAGAAAGPGAVLSPRERREQRQSQRNSSRR